MLLNTAGSVPSLLEMASISDSEAPFYSSYRQRMMPRTQQKA